MSAEPQKGIERQFGSDLAAERAAAEEMMAMMLSMVPPEARIILCQFPGDPDDIADTVKWSPKVWKTPLIQDKWNVYVCVSAMGRGGQPPKFRKAKECWDGGLVFMIDDIGTKLPMDLIDRLEPTALIETSEGNYQAVYIFDRLVEDAARFDALINNFVDKYSDGKDTGMKGINRVFRPPFGINGKARHYRDGKPWKVRLARWNPRLRYSLEDIAEAFLLSLTPPPPRIRSTRGVGDRDARMAFFKDVCRILKRSGAFKKTSGNVFNRAGWAEITCPWVDGHTGAADSGAAIRWPTEDNDYNGAFKCHHGTCEGRGWSDLLAALDEPLEQLATQIAESNASAPERMPEAGNE